MVALAATLASFIILVTTVLVLVAGRQEALSKARDTSANVVAALARDLARNLEIYDLSLLAVVDGMSDPSILQLPPELRRQILFDRSTTAPFVTGIYAIDEHGRMVQGRARVLPSLNLSDREYFQVHRSRDDLGLYISQPFLSRLRNGAPTIALTRRISKPDGSFGGIALIALDLDYFQQLVDGVKLGSKGAATIMQLDGHIVARSPKLPGKDIVRVTSPTFLALLRSTGGSFVTRSPVDGVERLSTFASVRDSNLVAMVAPATSEVIEEWKHRSLIIGTLVVVVSCAFTAVVWLLVFAVRQRDAAQASLIAIADTDGLTGVANRRRLETALTELWARASRQQVPVAILFVDADHFKAFNDAHGHNAGDHALQIIARCLMRRAGGAHDIVARYGGEEFVVVLADCSPRRAEEVADAMRRDIAGFEADANNQAPLITVSIGLTVCRPDRGAHADIAMRRADEALYASKRNGRNRVSVAAYGEDEQRGVIAPIA